MASGDPPFASAHHHALRTIGLDPLHSSPQLHESHTALHFLMEPTRTFSSSSQDAPPIDDAHYHPFASSTAKLELLPPDSLTASGIDVEAEARLYDQLCEEYESEVRSQVRFDSTNNSVGRTNFAPEIAESQFETNFTNEFRRSGPESIVSIFISDNTGASGTFAADVQISGWMTVAGDKVPSLERGKSMKGLGAGAYVGKSYGLLYS